jgi:CheY-like chemotaxis protein
VKFTHSGAVIFGYKIQGKTIEYFVTDTGIGIEPEFQAKVFDNFRQFETATTRDYEGSGLGLSISRGIVELLNGSIQVDSRVGGGSTFRIMIPYLSIHTKSIEPESDTSDDTTPKKMVILLVEDDLANFSLQEKIIRKAGYLVIPASNGQEAIDQIENNPSIAAVIMDLKMPVMDGYEATRRIKTRRPGLPVIAVTAFAMTGDEQKALEAGCDQYLAKPIMESDLVKILGKLRTIPLKTL